MKPTWLGACAVASLAVGVAAFVVATNLYTVCAYPVRSYHVFFDREISDATYRTLAATSVPAVLASPLLPLVWLGRCVRRWCSARLARSVGHCRMCGYDLTGNVSGVCPECGTPATPGGSRPR